MQLNSDLPAHAKASRHTSFPPLPFLSLRVKETLETHAFAFTHN